MVNFHHSRCMNGFDIASNARLDLVITMLHVYFYSVTEFADIANPSDTHRHYFFLSDPSASKECGEAREEGHQASADTQHR